MRSPNAMGLNVNDAISAAEICGDIPLSFADRLRYLAQNACRNIRTVGRGPRTVFFKPDMTRAATTAMGQSPGRLLLELFIESELPELIAPGEIEIAEIGCGSGSMSARLARLGYRGRYTGVDIQDRFRRDKPPDFPLTVDFVKTDAHAFAPAQKLDLMVSVSALEHIPNDSALIERFNAMFKAGGVEVHSVPSGPALLIYLWHGYRQYTPWSLGAKFGPTVRIVRLGGFASYLLHFLFVTVSDLVFNRSLRKAMPGLYRSMVLGALRADRVLPFFPSSYVAIRRH